MPRLELEVGTREKRSVSRPHYNDNSDNVVGDGAGGKYADHEIWTAPIKGGAPNPIVDLKQK